MFVLLAESMPVPGLLLVLLILSPPGPTPPLPVARHPTPSPTGACYKVYQSVTPAKRTDLVCGVRESTRA